MKSSTNLLRTAVLIGATLCWVLPAAAQVTLSVLNPRGEIPPPPLMGIQPRVTDLAGKRIALIDNGKAGARNFLDAVQQLLQQKYPGATFLKPHKQILQQDARDWYPEIAKQFDAFIFATGD